MQIRPALTQGSPCHKQRASTLGKRCFRVFLHRHRQDSHHRSNTGEEGKRSNMNQYNSLSDVSIAQSKHSNPPQIQCWNMQVRDTLVDYLSLTLPGKRCVFTTLPHSSSPLQQHFPLHTTILLCNTQIEQLLTGENHTTVSLHWLFISFSMPTWLRHGSRLIPHTWCWFPHPGWQGNRYTFTRGWCVLVIVPEGTQLRRTLVPPSFVTPWQ